jgi:hypothetical protein
MRITFINFLFLSLFLMVSCNKDDSVDLTAKVTVNGQVLFDNGDDFNGDVDASFTGNGGSATKTFSWQNNLATADYNADITATAEGVFRMVVKDADSNTVLDKSLNGEIEPDSFSGVTSSGTSGIWTVTITLTSFNGDGSFSLSEGN